MSYMFTPKNNQKKGSHPSGKSQNASHALASWQLATDTEACAVHAEAINGIPNLNRYQTSIHTRMAPLDEFVWKKRKLNRSSIAFIQLLQMVISTHLGRLLLECRVIIFTPLKPPKTGWSST